jgi:hypothetical protein
LRAIAIENGLDPDRALPEDILLLAKDKDGTLLVVEELARCQRWLAADQGRQRAESVDH